MYVAWFRLNAAPPNCVSSFAFVTVTPGLPGVRSGAAALGISTVVCSTRGQAQSLPQSPGQAASSVPSHCSVPLATPSPQAGRHALVASPLHASTTKWDAAQRCCTVPAVDWHRAARRTAPVFLPVATTSRQQGWRAWAGG